MACQLYSGSRCRGSSGPRADGEGAGGGGGGGGGAGGPGSASAPVAGSPAAADPSGLFYSPFERNLIPSYLALDSRRQAEVVGGTGEGFRAALMEVTGKNLEVGQPQAGSL